jgi:hypothetical protein
VAKLLVSPLLRAYTLKQKTEDGMSITDIILNMPRWYFVTMILFSLFYASRGVMAQMREYSKKEGNSKKEDTSLVFRIVYSYIQEILFKVTFTTSSFIALLTANHIFSSVKSVSEIGSGTAIILVFLIIWSISGISGYLTLMVVSGKFPILK